MSSTSYIREYLNSGDMRIIDLALSRVQRLYSFTKNSTEEIHAAIVLIREFQQGNTVEDDLVAVFKGDLEAMNFDVKIPTDHFRNNFDHRNYVNCAPTAELTDAA